MKKIFVLALALTAFASMAFSNDHIAVNGKVENTFSKTFAQATNVSWENTNRFSKASFRIDGQRMFAYYTLSGELMAVTRYISMAQLPMDVAAELKKNFNNQWLTDLFEVSCNGETSYVAELTSADQVVTLKTDLSGKWDVFKKERIAGK